MVLCCVVDWGRRLGGLFVVRWFFCFFGLLFGLFFLPASRIFVFLTSKVVCVFVLLVSDLPLWCGVCFLGVLLRQCLLRFLFGCWPTVFVFSRELFVRSLPFLFVVDCLPCCFALLTLLAFASVVFCRVSCFCFLFVCFFGFEPRNLSPIWP